MKKYFLFILFLFPFVLFSSDWSVEIRQGMLRIMCSDWGNEFKPGYYIEGIVGHKINANFAIKGAVGHFVKGGHYMTYDKGTRRVFEAKSRLRMIPVTLLLNASYPIYKCCDVFAEVGPRYFITETYSDKHGNISYNKLCAMFGGGLKFYLNKISPGKVEESRGFFATLFSNYSFYSSKGEKINPWIIGAGLGYQF